MSNATQSLAATRIASLLDANSFVEIGQSVTARNTDFNLGGKKAPSDGVVTGYGICDGSLVYVYSQDVSVLGGTIGEMHAKKISSLYDLAIKMGAPIIGLIDCGGLRLEEATDALQGFGEIYKKQVMASGVVPQITAILGSCGGGLAMFPALTDFTFVEAGKGKLFVNSPNALAGNTEAKKDTADAAYQAAETGLVDGIGTEDEIFAKIRSLISLLPSNNEADDNEVECADDINHAVPDITGMVANTGNALSLLADDYDFFENKPDYGKDIAAGFLRLNGTTVGAVANRSLVTDEEGKELWKGDETLSAAGAEKAADLVKFCDAFDIPVLTLTNVRGFKADLCNEKKIAKSVGAMIAAFADATVPKVNVIIGKAFGNAYVAMNSKAIGADVTLAWDSACVGMMDASLAAKIMYPKADAKELSEKADAYGKLQNSIEMAAARAVVDTVISAEDTRKYVIGSMEMLYTKREDRPTKKHGTV
ncbi:MAG: carboxyl transferase [Blautia sp.]|nr:carboxyl transferase [Blautia sp.]